MGKRRSTNVVDPGQAFVAEVMALSDNGSVLAGSASSRS